MRFFEIFHKTPLHIAVAKQNINIVTILLNHTKIDINIKDEILKKS